MPYRAIVQVMGRRQTGVVGKTVEESNQEAAFLTSKAAFSGMLARHAPFTRRMEELQHLATISRHLVCHCLSMEHFGRRQTIILGNIVLGRT